MQIIWSIIIGYAIGCISPSAIISKFKQRDLRKEGTGNLGATNVTMVLGKRWGIFVMLFDIGKGVASYWLARLLFSDFAYAGLLSGLFAMVGHIFPFYLKFKGGKGLATFAGVIISYNPLLFLILLICCMVVMFIVNYSFVVPYAGAVFFCLIASIYSLDIVVLLLTACMGSLIIWKHFGNLKKAKNSEDIKVRDYIKKHILGKKVDE